MFISEKLEKLILTLAALLIAVFSYFLYDDSLLFPRRNDSGLPVVGSVDLTDRDVRLKSATTFTWLPAAKSDQVFLRDSIFTGENSRARIRLKDGADLELGENSLVTLNEVDGQINLDLRFGGLASRAGGKPLNVRSGGETIQIDGSGVVNLKRSSKGDIEVSVREGSARVRTKSGVHSVQDGKALEVTPTGAVKPIVMDKIQPLTPNGHRIHKAKVADPIGTQWKRHPTAKTYEWDLCANQTCSQVLQKTRGTKPSAVTTEPIPAGRYFWRVTAFNQRGSKVAASDIQSVEVTVQQPPEIVATETSPVLSREIKVPDENTPLQAEAELAWRSKEPVASYEYQIATTPEFDEIIHQAQDKTGRAMTPPLANGTYYYHVRGVLANGRSTEWSNPQELKVDLTASLVEVPGPVRFAKSIFDFDPEEEAARSPSSTPTPKVVWTPAEKARHYELEIAQDPSFENAKKIKTARTAFDWEGYEPGAWHLRVKAVSNDNVAGPAGKARLIVKSDKPVLQPFDKFERMAEAGKPAPPIEAKAQWTALPKADAYRLQIAEDPEFTSPQQLISRSPASTVKVEKPGTYFVRVQGLDEDGNPVSSFSIPQPLEYSYREIMQPPKLAEPYDRAAIFLQTTREPMFWLEWHPVNEATSYEVQIAVDENFNKILFSTESEDPRVLLKNRVRLGTFYWRVRSRINAEARASAWSEARSFTIDSQRAGRFGQ